ncbi:hypothetical protein [Caldiplasma sukawensis]
MKTKYLIPNKSSGNFGLGMAATFLSMAILGPFLSLGWILSGFFGGLIARGPGRGFAAALIGGLIISVVVFEMSILVSPSLFTDISNYTGNFFVLNQAFSVFSEVRAYYKVNSTQTLIKILIEGGVVPAIGGFIGGSIIKNSKSE